MITVPTADIRTIFPVTGRSLAPPRAAGQGHPVPLGYLSQFKYPFQRQTFAGPMELRKVAVPAARDGKAK